MTNLDKYLRQSKYQSPRLVTYSGKYDSISDVNIKAGDEIKSIILDNEEIIEPRVMKVGSKIFKCNKIIVSEHSSLYNILKLEFYYTILNKTTNYLLPTLFTVDEARVGQKALLYETNFVNAYINMDEGVDNYSIYLLYRFDGSTNMGNLEEWFKKLDIYMNTYQPDKYHTIYQFRVKDEQAYDTFINSRFSDFNEKHKKKIEYFFALKKSDYKYQIINNSDELRTKMEFNLGTVIPKNISLNNLIDLKMETYDTKEMQVIYTLAEEEI